MYTICNPPIFSVIDNINPNLLGDLRQFGNLSFFKNYSTSQVTANADYSIGSGTVTVTSARAASAPSTYFTSAGAIQTLTTANVPRWTQGFYDSTGFHSRPGLIIEVGGSFGKNSLIQSINTFSNVAWTSVNMTVNDSESDAILAPTVSSLTASAGNATTIQALVDGTPRVYTASIFIKRKTGTGIINLRANALDSYTDITNNVGTSWTRVQVVSSSQINPSLDIQIVTNGDAVYVYGAQLEFYPYMTSYVPTTAVARTRAAEKISYVISGNRTTTTETIFFKVTPLYNVFINDTVQRTFIDSDTKERIMRKSNTSNILRQYANLTDSSGAIAVGTTSPSPGTSYVFAGAVQHNPPIPYITISIDGTREGIYTSADWTDPAWGTNFYVGSDTVGALQANAIFESVAIYSNFKDVPDVNHISATLSSNVTYRNYLLLPDATSASNVVSGGATGNVITNALYEFNGVLVRTGSDTAIKLDKQGGDDTYPTYPDGIIDLMTYTISTNTWGSQTNIYDSGTLYIPFQHFARIVGSQIYLYTNEVLRNLSGLNNRIVLSKSTDLTGSSWDGGTVVYSDPAGTILEGNILGWIDSNVASRGYLVIGGFSPNKTRTLQSNDNGNTFVGLGPTIITSSTHAFSEGAFINISGGRIIGILRDNLGDYIYQVNSSDYGQTWTAPFSTGLGSSSGVKVTPKLIKAAGHSDYLTMYFYDRGDARNKIVGPTNEDNAFNNNWRPVYLMGTNSQGNGDICVIDDTLLRYLCYQALEVAGAPKTTNTLWWVMKDIWNWIAQ